MKKRYIGSFVRYAAHKHEYAIYAESEEEAMKMLMESEIGMYGANVHKIDEDFVGYIRPADQHEVEEA